MTVAAILLAAGESTRMGKTKALLDWGGRPLLEHQVRELLAGGVTPVLVVLGHQAECLRGLLPNDPSVVPVLNPRYREGRSTSIAAGLAALPTDIQAFCIQNVDQPIDRDIIRHLIAAHRAAGARLSIPVRAGKRGHPPLFSADLRAEVATVSEDTAGLKRIVRAHEAEILRVPIASSLVALNLNRPEDYAAAQRLARATERPESGT